MRHFRYIAPLLICLSLIAPVLASTPEAAEPGSLIITVTDDYGSAVPGVCWTIEDGFGGRQDFCDNEGDGIITLVEVTPGSLWLSQTSVPEGYQIAAGQEVVVTSGQQSDASFVSPRIPTPEPTNPVTPEPTATEPSLPTETPTLTATEQSGTVTPETTVTPDATATEETLISPASWQPEPFALIPADAVSATTPIAVSCEFDSSTEQSDFWIRVYKFDADRPDENDPGLTITINGVDRNFEPIEPVTYSNYYSGELFLDKPWRSLEITVKWPSGLTGSARIDCDSSLLTSVITTQVMSGETAVPDGDTIASGASMNDTAVLTGTTEDASGTVTYNLYANLLCLGTPVQSFTVDVVDAIVPPSGEVSVPDGLYEWQAVYSGDEHNATATSLCGSESVQVGTIGNRITTVMYEESGRVIPHEGSTAVNGWVYDVAFLPDDLSADATGVLTFNLWNTADCSGTPLRTSEVPVTDITAGTRSESIGSLPVGTYYWTVRYSGDANNSPEQSGCGSEIFHVEKTTPALYKQFCVNTLGDTDPDGWGACYGGDGSYVPDNPVGSSMWDVAYFADLSVPLTGSVTFRLYHNDATCSGTPVHEYTIDNINLTAWEQVRTPADIIMTPGEYRWVISYSGDENYNPVTTNCGDQRSTFRKLWVNWGSNTTMYRQSEEGPEVVPHLSYQLAPAIMGDTMTIVPNDQTSLIPTGTVTFTLYRGFGCPASAQVGSPITVTVNADGTVPTAWFPTELATAGVYYWRAAYSGDTQFNAYTTDCGSEIFFLETPGRWRVTTTPMGTMPDGTDKQVGRLEELPPSINVWDTAHVEGWTEADGGSVVFRLYANAGCTGTPVYTSSAMPVVDGVAQTPKDAYRLVQNGAYSWQAVFTSAAGTVSSPSYCELERFTVTSVSGQGYTIMYRVGADGIAQPMNWFPARMPLGESIYDTIAFYYEYRHSDWGVYPEGTLTYNVYSGNTCSGTPVFTSKVRAHGDGTRDQSALFTPTATGTYTWQVVFTPDPGKNAYQAATTRCGDETFIVAEPVTITTTMYQNGNPLPNNAQLSVGDELYDTVELTWPEGLPAPTGTISYMVFADSTCGSEGGYQLYGESFTINEDGTVPQSSSIIPYAKGPHSILVTYGGDSIYAPTQAQCGLENFTVTGDMRITTVMYDHWNGGVINHGDTITLPAIVGDGAIFAGYTQGESGDLTFALYKGTTCSEDQKVDEFVYEDITLDYPRWWSDSVSLDEHSSGIYNWVVTWQSDVEGSAPVVSPCGSETFRAIYPQTQTIAMDCSYNSIMGRSSFHVVLSRQDTTAGDYDENLTVVAQPYDMDGNALEPITYHNYDSLVGENHPNFTMQDWSSLTITATWPTIPGVPSQTRTASSSCSLQRAEPTISTVMMDPNGEEIAHESELTVGISVYDTAIIDGGAAPVTGTVTYELYRGETCETAVLVADAQTRTITNGLIPNSDPIEITVPGTYNWVVTYSGDGANSGATSECGQETFIASPAQPVVTTTMTTNGAELPQNGTVLPGAQVGDSATIESAVAPITGTVTYELYRSAECGEGTIVGEPQVKQIVDGVIPIADPVTVTEPGTYNWVVTYSGDVRNSEAISPCGSETFSIAKLPTSVSTTMYVDGVILDQGANVEPGTAVYDAAMIDGIDEAAVGTITYELYHSVDCGEGTIVGEPQVKAIANGDVPNADPITVTAPGTYNWVVTYSGDVRYSGSVSECGQETFVVTEPDVTPTVTSTPGVTPTATSTPDVTPTATSTPDVTPTATSTPDVTPTKTPDETAVPTATGTVAPEPTSPPVTGLPTTGSGSGKSQGLILVAIAAAVTALVGLGLRRNREVGSRHASPRR